MKILTVNELTQQGISIAEVQKSLTMTYLTKNFRRKSDLPKKFREKALSICTEINSLGKESFVIETNYSYTVWEEEKSIDSEAKIENKSPNSLEVKNNNINGNVNSVMKNNFSSTPQVESNSFSEKTTTVTANSGIQSGKTEYNLFQYTSNNDSLENIRERKNQRLSSASEIAEEVVKYRGVAVSQPVTQATITPQANQSITVNGKPRTYRGVAY